MKLELNTALLEVNNSRNNRLDQVNKAEKKKKRLFFWDAKGIILNDPLKNGKTSNGQYNAELLQLLTDEVQNKRPLLTKKTILFHHDNAYAHSSLVEMAEINEMKFELFLNQI